jgi:hypothetical protein
MARSLVSTNPGTTADYQKYLYGEIKKTSKVNSPILFDFALASVEDPAFVKLVRGNYIKFTTDTYGLWFTGYIQNNPTPEYIGVSASGLPTWLYHYEAASDDVILGYQPLGFIEPYINTTQGKILKDLANRLAPGVFDVTDVQDGRTVVFYRVDPTKKFADIVKEFATSAHFRFWSQDKKLHFVQQDTVACALTIDGSGTNKNFTPSALKLDAATEGVFNDVMVIGANEPQNYVTEYWVSDGFTARLPLISDMFGAVNSNSDAAVSVYLDETFSQDTIDQGKWAVQDPTAAFLQASNGFLNALGGNNNGSYNIYIRSILPIMLQGALRLTHGDIDFVSASSGILGSLWTTETIAGATLTGCVFGLKCSKSGGNTVINPIVGGAVDTSQSITITDYTKRYVMRTLVSFKSTYRNSNTYSYLGSDGAVNTYGNASVGDTATFSTIITVIDPTTGLQSAQYRFNNANVALDSTQLAAFYAPIISDDMHITVTSITLGSPLLCSLSHKSEMDYTWTLTPPAGASLIAGTSDAFVLAEQTRSTAGDVISAQITQLVGDTSAEFVIMARQDLTAGSAYYAIAVNRSGAISIRARATAGGATGISFHGETIPFGSYLKIVHNDKDSPGTDLLPTTRGYYSLDGVKWTAIGSGGSVSINPSSYYLGFAVVSNTTAQTTYATLSKVVLPDPSAGLALSGIGASGGSITHTGANWVLQHVGPNEVDAQDGLAPVATVLSTSGNNPPSAFNGTYYNPGSSSLQYFASKTLNQDGTISSTSISLPQPGTLLRLAYRASGPAVGRVVDPVSVTAEATAWGDSGHRADVRTDISPVPRTSQECEAAAAAIVQEFAYQHYQGSYAQASLFEFTGEPLPGTILPFLNLSAVDFPGIQNEVVTQVESTFVSAKPREVFNHTVSFGGEDVLNKFLATLEDVSYNPTIPNSPSSIPAFLNIANVATSYAIDVTSVDMTGWDASTWQWQINATPPAGGGFEIRYTNRAWGPNDGSNLIARQAGTTFTTPRTLRGKTVYVRAYDASGHYSRYAAAGRSNLPLQPAAPTATIDYTNGLHPVISINNPALMQDVWGVEIRAADNRTVLYRMSFADTGFTSKFTDFANILLNPQYYIYTYNLLGEFSASFHLQTPDLFISAGPDGLNLVRNGTFEKNDWGALYNTPRHSGEIVGEEWYIA